MDIQAAVAHGNAQPLVIEPVQLAEPGDDDILVRIVATGLCHSDLTILNHAPLPWPAILGHEGAGVVEAVGSRVTRVKPGDHVVLSTTSCGRCPSCLKGEPSYCVEFRAVNMSGGRRPDGSCTHHQHGRPVFGRFFGQSSFASHLLATERNVIPVPSDLPLELLAPLGCGIQTGAGAVLNTLKVRSGGSLAVFGAGAVGLSALMAARIAGCTTLVAVDKLPSRLDLARELGATHVVDAGREDAVARVREITGGGADYTVEAAGSTAVMAAAIEALGHRGAAVLIGVTGATASVSFNPTLLQARGQTIKGSLMAGDGAVPALFIQQLIAHHRDGRLPFDRFVRFYDFADINQAIHDAHDGSAIKPILRLPQA